MDIDFTSLAAPLADGSDGPDLGDDPQFAQFEADIEGFLPTKADDFYFGFRKINPDLDTFGARTLALLDRSRDVRLLVALAKIAALQASLPNTAAAMALIRHYLTERWDTVQPEAGESVHILRGVAVERLDEFAAFVLPLQYTPLVSDRNGQVCYRDHAVASGALSEREGDSHPSQSDIERVLARCDLDVLVAARDTAASMVDDLAAITLLWAARDTDPSSLVFRRLAPMLEKMAAFLDGSVANRDPALAKAAPEDETAEDPAAPAADAGATPSIGTVQTLWDAKAALIAASRYFEHNEPSSPAFLLLKKSQALIGLTFPQLIQQIAPDAVYSTAIPLPGRKRISLPMEKLTEEFAYVEVEAAEEQSPTQDYAAPDRASATALLSEVARWYRVSEPSNPIPLLLDKARELMSKDFASLLTELTVPDA
ncbi:type VI secretion system ImpA family N-terminal domain-containing protein [Acuticoccus sp. MNP-M23]|uniref:type VI secretion system protein TssA n=1 Tax=Acuticoccus sp. MNP-M23 TaxID=3072793 RepID=UPI0028153094|nr:type VI secretion system ImpA family N-terminal domain-containing protein [Acuticoccus sp. MNP-M23]WMS44152.1 type VI secretion system ImpA family N-terminal domain-containing protein [Acuticoccus sp. MNP-M23]